VVFVSPRQPDTALVQSRDLCCRIAVLGEDLVAVQAECRRGARRGPRRVGEFDRLRQCAVAADHWMINLPELRRHMKDLLTGAVVT
jgi:hypothetical protein